MAKLIKPNGIKFDRKFNNKCYGVASTSTKILCYGKSEAKRVIKRQRAGSGDLIRMVKTPKGYVIYSWWEGRIGNC